MLQNLENSPCVGFQAWFRFVKDHKGAQEQYLLGLADRILHPKRVSMESVREAIENLRQDIFNFERGGDQRLGKALRTLSVSKLVPLDLAKDLRMQSDNFQNYEAMEQWVIQQSNVRKGLEGKEALQIDHRSQEEGFGST